MATRPKAVIESRNGEKFSPITITKNVLTDDGQNLHDILSDRKEDMMTPTIENSSSMFKVGQGDNVDYSSNVVNGAYESMVLKGKTMVNCIQESSSQDVVLPYEFADGQYVTINDTKESGALGVELKGQTLVNLISDITQIRSASDVQLIEYSLSPMSFIAKYGTITANTSNNRIVVSAPFRDRLKLNEDYTIIYDYELLENPDGVDCQISIAVDSWGQMADSPIVRTPGSMGKVIHCRNRASNAISETLNFINNKGTNAKWKISNLMLLEGNWTNKDIPTYFEGMASCKMPILHTVGKNLYEGKDYQQNVEANKSTGDLPLIMGHVKLKKNTDYCISYSYETNTTRNDTVYGLLTKTKVEKLNKHNALYSYHHEGYEGNGQKGNSKELTQTRFNTGDFEYLYFGVNSTSAGQNGYIKYYNIQLEESSSPTAYEPHKSSVLSLPEEVVLRSLPNGVCDTFNTRTGVYTQRIGEVVLDGSDSINDWMFSASNNTFRTSFNKHGIIPFQGNGFVHVISDKYTTLVYADDWNSGAFVSMDTYNRVVFRDDRFSSLTDWHNSLKQNAITVQYILETPVVTKINLPSTLKSWNTTTHIYSETPENTLYPILSHSNPTYPVILKPSTKYSIIANSYSNSHTNSTINFNLGGATVSTTVGNRVTAITTPSTLSNELLTMSGRGNKLNNAMVIEGDVVGDEPYFEGMCDSKSPILSNIGKNLLDIKKAERRGSTKCSFINNGDGSITLIGDGDGGGEGIFTTSCYAYLKEGKTYTFSFESDGQYSSTNGTDTVEAFLLKDGSASEYVHHMTDFITTFTCGRTGDYYVRFDVNKNNTTHKFWNIQLTEGATVYPYEPYKSNILSCETYFDETTQSDKTIVLRSLPSGVCDTLNVETGEYVQRIGEVVLDGSGDEQWSASTPVYFDNLLRWKIGLPRQSTVSVHRETNMVCDRVKVVNYAFFGDRNYEFVSIHENGVDLQLMLEKSKAATVAELKEYLQQHPTIVQYELATPIVSTVDIQGFPFSYENGHIQLSSGSIEQSLTPKVEYSVVTNRSGQIRNNQKMVERHQKQLDRLQAMILTNLVNTQYEQALTNLKYDLKNVREEVK